jgi:hypothetical protein
MSAFFTANPPWQLLNMTYVRSAFRLNSITVPANSDSSVSE